MSAREKRKIENEIAGLDQDLKEYLEDQTSMKNDMALVHIYFKELGIVKYSRDQLYSIMDVIGNKSSLNYRAEVVGQSAS